MSKIKLCKKLISTHSTASDNEKSFDREQYRILMAERFCLLDEVTRKNKKIADLEKKLKINTNLETYQKETEPYDPGNSPKPMTSVSEEKMGKEKPKVTKKTTQKLKKCKLVKPNSINPDKNDILTKNEYEKSEITRILDELSNKTNSLLETERKLSALQITYQTIVDQLTACKAKLFESLNMNTQLRSELKLAQKCIEHETGETFKVALVNAKKPSWRGRAQQICVLQKKLADLKSKYDANNSNACDPTIVELRKADSQRRLELERLSRRLVTSQTENEEIRTKLNAQRLRNTNLQEEVTELKEKICSLNDQRKKDALHLTELDETITANNSKHENHVLRLVMQLEAKQCELIRLDSELKASENNLNNATKSISDKCSEISELHEKIQRTEQHLKSACGDFLFDCRDLKKDEYMAILDVLEFEKENLIAQVKTLSDRLDEERTKNDSQSEQIRRLNIKNCRIELKYNEMMAEQETLKKRHLRTNRIANYVRSTTSIVAPSNTVVNADPISATSLQSNRAQDTSFRINYQLSDLQNKLDFATERIRLLEENIRNLRQEKAKDVDQFTSILTKSKFVLRDHLLARKLNELSCTTLGDRETPERELSATSLIVQKPVLSVCIVSPSVADNSATVSPTSPLAAK